MRSGLADPKSLDAPAIQGEENGRSKLDHVIDANPPRHALDVSTLDKRERIILQARVDGHTLDEIGDGLGVSGERVRQLASPIFSKLDDSDYNRKVGWCRELILRRGYKKPSRSGWAKAVDDARFPRLKQIRITKHLSGAARQQWLERLSNAETTEWGRKTAGTEKRFAVEGSVRWSDQTPDAVERARQKTPDEQLHKFLDHHQLERFRISMRAKLDGDVEVKRPRKGVAAWVKDPTPTPEPGTIWVKRKGPYGGAIYFKPALFGPSEKVTRCSHDGRKIVFYTFPLHHPQARP